MNYFCFHNYVSAIQEEKAQMSLARSVLQPVRHASDPQDRGARGAASGGREDTTEAAKVEARTSRLFLD